MIIGDRVVIKKEYLVECKWGNGKIFTIIKIYNKDITFLSIDRCDLISDCGFEPLFIPLDYFINIDIIRNEKINVILC